MGDKTFREGFALLGRLGLSFDAWLYHPQIDELADLARAFLPRNQAPRYQQENRRLTGTNPARKTLIPRTEYAHNAR
jgi:hypothetical protein